MYRWEVIELEMQDGGFETVEEAYQDAKDYFEADGYDVGDLDGDSFSLYCPGDSRQGFLEFCGDGFIVEEDEE